MSLTNIRAVNETEEIKERDRGDDEPVDLSPELLFLVGVKYWHGRTRSGPQLVFSGGDNLSA